MSDAQSHLLGFLRDDSELHAGQAARHVIAHLVVVHLAVVDLLGVAHRVLLVGAVPWEALQPARWG